MLCIWYVIWHAIGIRDLVNPPNVDEISWSLALESEIEELMRR
jgi:hypothetical protein